MAKKGGKDLIYSSTMRSTNVHNTRKGFFAFLVLFFALNHAGFAQYGYYYEHGASKTNEHLGNQRGSRYVTQITHFNYDYVYSRVHSFLTYSMDKVAMEEMQEKKSGKYTTYSRRYKSEFSDEINTIFTITTEYKTAVVGGERVIVSAKIFGYESYVGKFLEEFWKPTMNASDKKSGEVMKFNFMDDHVSVNLFTDKDSYLDMASLVITNTSTASFSDFKKKLEPYLADFKQKRAEKTYQIANEDEAMYSKNKNTILTLVKEHLLRIGDNQTYTGKLEVSLKVDTSGNTLVTIPSDFPGSLELSERLNKSYYNKYTVRDFYLRTDDTYSFDINFFSEVGNIFATNKSINFKEGSKSFEEKVDAKFREVDEGRGNYTIQARDLTIDNTEIKSDLVVKEFDKKMGPLGYAAGAGVVAAGILYFFVLN